MTVSRPEPRSTGRPIHKRSRSRHTKWKNQVKSKPILTLLAVLALLSPMAVQAASTNASAKVTIQSSYLNVIPTTTTPTAWHTVLAQNLKMANNHDLLMTAAFEV